MDSKKFGNKKVYNKNKRNDNIKFGKNKRFSKKSTSGPSKLKPGSDKKLKEVFKRIGVPGPTEFKADRFQQEAIDLVPIEDCIVTAPTGAGKTWIAEVAMEKIFKSGKILVCISFKSPYKHFV